MKIKGITRRWASNNLLVIAIILFTIVIVSIAFVLGYYRNYVSTFLNGYANESVTNFFTPYINASDELFSEKSKEFVDSFSDKGLMEVQVINRYGRVAVSSSGFKVDESVDSMDDVLLATGSSSGIAQKTMRNANREKVLAVAMVLPESDGDFTGAVRFITSLKNVELQILYFAILALMVFAVAIFFVGLSGRFFIYSIVTPVRKINDVTKRFAEGDFDVRVEIDGNEDDEINDLAESVNGMINEVAATDKLKNDFISTVSHELRTPLTAIKGWGEMLKEIDGEDRELSRRGTEVIINESDRLSRLVEELLDFSRMQNGRMTLRLEKIDVIAELDETIFVFKERSNREGIELSYLATDVPVPMQADPNRIKQVFVNILDNAFKYNKQGGSVKVEASVLVDDNTSLLIITFNDDGCGITKEDLPNVKKKFYKTNLQVRGSGIGLAVVDEIIKLHKGTLDIESEIGVGTVVTVRLPVETVKLEPPIVTLEEATVETNE